MAALWTAIEWLGRTMSRLNARFFVVLMLCISCSTVTVGFILYMNAKSSLQQEIGLSNLAHLRQANTFIDMVFSEVNRTAGNFALDEQVNEYSYTPFPPTLSAIRYNLGVISETNKVIHSIYLYFESPAQVLSSIYGEVYALQQFYDIGWLEQYRELTYSSILPTRPFERTVGDSSAKANVISQLRSIPFVGDKRGAVVINIDEDILTERITQNIARANERFIAADAGGTIILSSDKSLLYRNMNDLDQLRRVFETKEGYYTLQLEGEPALATFTSSDKLGWKYISLIPTAVVYERIRHTQIIIVITCLALIALGMLASGFLSSRMYRPLRRLVESVQPYMETKPPHRPPRNEVDFLGGVFQELTGENKWLEQKMADSLPALQESFFKSLIAAADSMPDDRRSEQQRLLGITFLSDHFQVLLFEINEADLNRRIKTAEGRGIVFIYFKDLIRKMMPDEVSSYIGEPELHLLGVIVNYHQAPEGDPVNHMLDPCLKVIRDSELYLNIRLHAGIGTVVPSRPEIPRSYAEARRALEFKHLSENHRALYMPEAVGESGADTSFLREKEQELIAAVQACDTEHCRLTIRGIETSCRTNRLPHDMVKGMFISLAIALGKEADGLPLPLTEFARCGSIEELGRMTERLCENIVGKRLSRKKSKYSRVIEQVQQFLSEHYHEDLGVDRAASLIGLSNSYFSKVFKEETGVTFVEYLTSLRMEQARRLLETTGLKINEIARRVGFHNEAYFIAQFKHRFHITPKVYQELNIWKNN